MIFYFAPFNFPPPIMLNTGCLKNRKKFSYDSETKQDGYKFLDPTQSDPLLKRPIPTQQK